MTRLTHLNALQALEAGLRLGTLKRAAEELGISLAAAGQRIRALEDYLDMPLLDRGPAGVRPTQAATLVQAKLAEAFAQLRDVADDLYLDRETQVRLVADPDWLDLWLHPRLARFHAEYPTLRLTLTPSDETSGAADVEVFFGTDPAAVILFQDAMLPVTTEDIHARVLRNTDPCQLEGLPLLHLAKEYGEVAERGWADWIGRFGQRRTGAERGVHFRRLAVALKSSRADVGVLLCPLSLVLPLIKTGDMRLLYPAEKSLPARNSYRMRVSARAARRRNVRAFVDWLGVEALETGRQIRLWTGLG